MAELVQKHQFQHALQEAVKPGLSPSDRAPHGETIGKYVGQLETAAEQTAGEIERLGAQVLKLQQEAEEAVPKAELERVSGELKLAQERAEETARVQEEVLQKLRAELEEAQREDPRIAGLTQQVQKLTEEKDGAVRLAEELRKRESSGETVPKATFEEAQRRVKELELEMAELAAQLKLAQSEDNPRVVELKGQLEQLGKAHEQATLKQQQVVERLEADVQRLTHAAEDHPIQIEEITRRAEGEALKVEALQVEMRRYQEVAVEVSRLPHDQAATKLEEARLAHGAIEEDIPGNNVQKAVLTYKIGLLEAKQAEHEAIQKRLEAAHRTGAEEALRSPELALQQQTALFEELGRQMEVDTQMLNTSGEEIPARLEEIGRMREEAAQERARIVDAASQGPEVQLQALRLDQAVAKYDNQLRMLTALQKTLEGFEAIGRGQAGLGLTDLYRVTNEALGVASEEYQRLDAIKDGTRDEGAIALQAEKVRGLEAQVEQLRVAVESYQEHAATRVAADAKFLEQLITLVPREVPGEQVMAYLFHAVQAIVAIQQTLTREFGDQGVHHDRIEGLLKQIYTWNQGYLGIMDDSINAVRGAVPIDGLMGYLRYELPNVVQTIVGYTQMPATGIAGEIEARETEIARLEQEYDQLDAVRDHTRDERAIQANRAHFAIQNIYRNTLLAIQGVHQPLRDAHAAEKTDLERQKSVLGTMQRLIVGFFSMLFSIPGMMIGGLQTMGHPLVGKPNH